MANLRVPSNQVVESKYTIGGEFKEVISLKDYKGYYYEFNSKYFVGETFDVNALELIPTRLREPNPLLTNLTSFTYSAIATTAANAIMNKIKPTSHVFQYDSTTRYYSYSIKEKIIKEINKENFDAIQSNILYTTVSLSYNGGFNNIELDEAEKKIPGIKTFVENSYIRPKTEDGGGLVG
jgi:hypothetical protein